MPKLYAILASLSVIGLNGAVLKLSHKFISYSSFSRIIDKVIKFAYVN